MTPNDGCVSQIHNQTNTRIYDRNIPSQVLQPYLNVRPVMTKYSFLPNGRCQFLRFSQVIIIYCDHASYIAGFFEEYYMKT